MEKKKIYKNAENCMQKYAHWKCSAYASYLYNMYNKKKILSVLLLY
jgi:hypothetical protein